MAPRTQFAAFDVAMDMAFSNPLSFTETGKDVDGIIHSLHSLSTGAGSIALFPSIVHFMQQPWIFPLVAPRPTAKSGPGYMYGLAWSQVKKRFDEEKSGVEHNDILQWIMEHEDREGQRLNRAQLEQESMAPVFAGSDTSATVLRAITLFAYTNPRVLSRVSEEIDKADAARLLSTPPEYEEVRLHVPYVSAMMRESLRLYPVVGSPMFRKVSRDGRNICGYYLPEDTEIGICHYPIGHNKAIFGEDADMFGPERWIADVDVETRRLRESGEVYFGSGAFMRTGRNVATLEVRKIATQLFRQLDVEVVNPLKPWQDKDSLAMLVWDFQVIFRPGEKNDKSE